MRPQNRSSAVMAQRIEPQDSPDDFPTPPWATRALIKHVLSDQTSLARMTCLEPACGAGHMGRVLEDSFPETTCSDAYSYGYGSVRDFLLQPYDPGSFDWVITNPPFRLAEQFVLQALRVARVGVAILARTVFLEGVGRHKAIFAERPPTTFAPFSERVPMLKGRLSREATTATSYSWFVWDVRFLGEATRLQHIPPCRKQLERDEDYPAV